MPDRLPWCCRSSPLQPAQPPRCDIAMADLRQKETAEWRKTYDLKAGGRLEISNVNGKIDVDAL